MESHRKWLLNPPTRKPEAADFGLEPTKVLSKEDINSFLEFLYLLIRDRIEWMEPSDKLRTLLLEEIDFKGCLKQHALPTQVIDYAQEMTRCSKDFIHLLQLSQQYKNELNNWNSYQKWLETRNPARKALEERCGYDSKNVAHCIRLLLTGNEILTTGKLTVDRSVAGDADKILAIRRGEFSYDEVKELSDHLFSKLDLSYSNSTLPHSPNLEAINELCIELVESYLSRNA